MTSLDDPDTLDRIAETLDALPRHWRDVSTRAHIFHALETAATLEPTHDARIRAWERVRYLAGFPSVPGIQTPLYASMSEAYGLDPETEGEPPSFDALMASLNYASGWSE